MSTSFIELDESQATILFKYIVIGDVGKLDLLRHIYFSLSCWKDMLIDLIYREEIQRKLLNHNRR